MVGQGKDARAPLPLNCAPPLWPAKREYKAVPAIADEIWRYRTGENLVLFEKDHDIAEEGRPRSLSEVKFLQPSMGVRYDC